MDKHHIVVVGAGYAGLMAALRLGGRTRGSAKVTLIDAADTFVQRIRMHQVATGQRVKQHNLSAVSAWRGVAFVHGRVTSIQPSTKSLTVQTAGGPQIIAYDTLVYALGSMIDRDRAAGVREHAYTLSPEGARGAAALAGRLRELPAGAAVTVAGGGLTGIEAVTELAELYPALRFTLVTRGVVGESVSAGGRDHIRRAFVRLNIRLIEGQGAAQVQADGVMLDDGTRLAHDVILWAGAFSVPPLAGEAGIKVNGRGQVVVDEYFRSVSHPDIYAVGDCAAAVPVSGIDVRMSCQSAMPQGAHAAEVISARLKGREAAPFRFGFLAQCISLGRHDGLVQFVRADDTPTVYFWTGRRAAVVKELVCRFTVITLLTERFAPLFRWSQGKISQQRASHALAR